LKKLSFAARYVKKSSDILFTETSAFLLPNVQHRLKLRTGKISAKGDSARRKLSDDSLEFFVPQSSLLRNFHRAFSDCI